MTTGAGLELLSILAERGDEPVAADALARAAGLPAPGLPPWSGLRTELLALEDEGLVAVDYALEFLGNAKAAPPYYEVRATEAGRRVVAPSNPA